MQETNHFLIPYCNVTRCLISYMHFMFLLYQTANGTSHRNHVIIRMRRKYDNTFRERFGTFGTIRIVSIRFSTGPSGNSVLQIVEYLDIHIICRTEESQQFAQTVFVIIFISKFQDRFTCQLA